MDFRAGGGGLASRSDRGRAKTIIVTERRGAPSGKDAAALVARVQGWFYIVSGLWPLVSGESFQAVTGLKADFWLAQTVGLLLTITGVVLVLAARARRVTKEIKLLGGLQAAALMVVDIYCVFQPRTTWSYLFDAVAELGIVIAWCVVGLRRED